jgi:hypothetical protein
MSGHDLALKKPSLEMTGCHVEQRQVLALARLVMTLTTR